MEFSNIEALKCFNLSTWESVITSSIPHTWRRHSITFLFQTVSTITSTLNGVKWIRNARAIFWLFSILLSCIMFLYEIAFLTKTLVVSKSDTTEVLDMFMFLIHVVGGLICLPIWLFFARRAARVGELISSFCKLHTLCRGKFSNKL